MYTSFSNHCPHKLSALHDLRKRRQTARKVVAHRQRSVARGRSEVKTRELSSMMRINRSKIAGAVTAALLLPQAIVAQAQNQSASPKEVEEVVVTGSRIAHGNVEAA